MVSATVFLVLVQCTVPCSGHNALNSILSLLNLRGARITTGSPESWIFTQVPEVIMAISIPYFDSFSCYMWRDKWLLIVWHIFVIYCSIHRVIFTFLGIWLNARYFRVHFANSLQEIDNVYPVNQIIFLLAPALSNFLTSIFCTIHVIVILN